MPPDTSCYELNTPAPRGPAPRIAAESKPSSDVCLSAAETPAQGLFTSVSRVCGVCTLQYSKYKCPRCALQYCSVACYRVHGEECTESFYAESAQATLRATASQSDQQIEMMRMLQRLEEEGDGGGGDAATMAAAAAAADDDDEDDEDDATEMEGVSSDAADDGRAERLSKLLSQTHIDEAQLTDDELREFRRLVADGSLGAQLQSTPAWWSQIVAGSILPTVAAGGRPTGVGWRYVNATMSAAASAAGAPELPQTLRTLQSLTSRTPSATLRFNFLEVICAYVYTWRLYCGTFDDDPCEAATALLSLSQVLNGQQCRAHRTAEEALLGMAAAAESTHMATSAAFGAACLNDARNILGDEGLAALALAGARALLVAAAKASKGGKGGKAGDDPRAKASAGAGADGTSDGGSELWAPSVISYAEPRSYDRAALKTAKLKADFLEVWWASRPGAERRATLEYLQFALKKDILHREELRAAGAPREKPGVLV